MKVLQFFYSLVPGGAERFVIDLANELANNNDTQLYVLRDDTIGNQGFYVPEISKNVKYINLKIDPGFKPWLIWTFYKILKRERPDVVHCHLNLVNYFFILSLIFHKSIRFVYTIHNSAETEVGSKIERVIRRYFFKHAFFIPVAISEETKTSYKQFYNLKEAPVIYNGRSFSGRTTKYSEVVNEIAAIKPSGNTLVFCHLARYGEQKNQKMLVTVFNRLRAEGFDIILLIIGEGFENAGDLKAIANDHIHFLGIRSNIYDYLYASDAFCLSSIYEGMPISLIEAFACGCVPVCTPVGGIKDTIENGVTGFLSGSVSEADYLNALKEFIRDRNIISKDTLVKYYKDNFSIEECTKSYMRIYSGAPYLVADQV
jgi:glycosyltransferase involved in cell wall biosynthesis